MKQQQRFTDDEIKQLVDGYLARGEMTRPQFCESRAMNVSTLDYYLRRYKVISKPVTRLAKVKVKASSSGMGGGFALVLANGRRIECGEAGLARLMYIAETM
jgi:hypothetical protein